MNIFKHILVPTDFSPSAQRAIDMAVSIAKLSGASITLLHVTDIPTYAYDGITAAPLNLLAPVHEAAERTLAKATEAIRAELPGVNSMLRRGYAAEEIIETVSDVHADLIVMGTHGRKGLGRLLAGSVAEKIVRTSTVPVLTVRGED